MNHITSASRFKHDAETSTLLVTLNKWTRVLEPSLPIVNQSWHVNVVVTLNRRCADFLWLSIPSGSYITDIRRNWEVLKFQRRKTMSKNVPAKLFWRANNPEVCSQIRGNKDKIFSLLVALLVPIWSKCLCTIDYVSVYKAAMTLHVCIKYLFDEQVSSMSSISFPRF